MADVAVKLSLFPALSSQQTPFLCPLKSSKRYLKSHSRRRKKVAVCTCISSSLVGQKQKLISFTEPEAKLIEALLGIQGRGRAASAQQLKDVERAVQALEEMGGVVDPTKSSLIQGRWQLMFTTRPGTASPIQRTFVGVELFKIFQEISLRSDDPRVSNIVEFSDTVGELKVEAAAEIEDGKRILFRFDRAAFAFRFLPFKVPYPVPFRLLGDEAKGWLDTTYLSKDGNIRISRGNKGTTFVLQKNVEPRQRLLEAISVGTGVMEVVDELVPLGQNEVKEPDSLVGEWQLLWASKSDESLEAVATRGLKGVQMIRKDGQMENVIEIFPSLQAYARGNLLKAADCAHYSVTMTDGAIRGGPAGAFKLPLNINSNFSFQLLYIDKKIRITRSDNGIIFIHFLIGKCDVKS